MTIEEDLKTHIDDTYDLADPTCTVYVFAKNDPDSVELEPPEVSDGTVIAIILPADSVPIRYAENTNLLVTDGTIILYAENYADMKAAIAEIRENAHNLSISSGVLSMNFPSILSDYREARFIAYMSYKWERLEARS